MLLIVVLKMHAFLALTIGSVMETVISVVGIAFVLVASLVV